MKKPTTAVTGTNLLHAKSHNRRAILNAVRCHDALSRAEMTRMTNLSAQTVSNLVAELEQDGLLIAGEPVRQKRGQPARQYRLSPDGGYAIGFQLSGTHMDAVLVNLNGELRAHIRRPINHPDPEQGVQILATATRDIIAEAGLDPARNIGIGVAMPGPVGVTGPTGIAPGWDQFDLATAMREETGCPVFIENDADAAAVSEKLYGKACELENFVYIFIGSGLGAGLFCNGRIIRGAHGAAGEIGHIPVVVNGRACECGRKGCLERYVSLLALYEAFDQDRRSELMENSLLLHLSTISPDDEPVRGWIELAAQHLTHTLKIIVSIMDPQAVIVGGLLPQSILTPLLDRIDQLQTESDPTPTGAPLPVYAGECDSLSAAFGAAALPIYQEIIPDFENMLKTRNQ